MRRYLGIMGLSLLLAAALLGVEKAEEKNQKEYVVEAVPEYEAHYDNVYDLLYISEVFDGLPFEVGALYNSDRDIYYLFLPWWMKDRKSITVYAAQDLEWEGKRIHAGESFALEMGGKDFLLKKDGAPVHLSVSFSSRLPVLWMETDGNVMADVHADKEYEAKISLSYLNITGENRIRIEEETGSIHCRGNASFSMSSKKSYLLEGNVAVDFWGNGGAKKWVLTSNCYDATMLRNYLTLQLAQRLKLPFTPEAGFVDLYVDGKYFGLYLMCPKIECGPGTVDIRDLDAENEEKNGKELFKRYSWITETQKGFRAESPEEISGGYLLELDLPERWEAEKSGFISENEQPVVIHAPKHATVEEVKYISEFYQRFENTLCEGKESSAYEEFIDVESFALKYIVEEFSKNLDANITSQFLYKDEDAVSTKFFAGPVWDYDRAWGNGGVREDGIDLEDPAGFYAKGYQDSHPIWAWLCEKESFYREVKELWREKAKPLAEEILEKDELRSWKDRISASLEMDGKRWEREYLETRGEGWDYEEEYQKLYDFIVERKAFLDQEWCE